MSYAPNDAGLEIARALGLKLEGLASFQLTVEPDDFVCVDAVYHVVVGDALRVTLKRFELHERVSRERAN